MADSPFFCAIPFYESAIFWAIVAVAVAIVGIVVAYRTRARQRKVLAYEAVVTALLHEEVSKTELEVRLYGEVVERVHLADVRIVNAGDAPVRSEDFETPLKVAVETGTLLDFDLLSAVPVDLVPSVNPWPSEQKFIEIEPLLLNPGDGFTVRLITADAPGEITLLGRIAGTRFAVSKPRSQREVLAAVAEGVGATASLGIGPALISALTEGWRRR